MSTSAEMPTAAIVTGTEHSPRHHKKKKASDPFLELVTEIDKPLDVPSIVAEDEGSRQETIFADVRLPAVFELHSMADHITASSSLYPSTWSRSSSR